MKSQKINEKIILPPAQDLKQNDMPEQINKGYTDPSTVDIYQQITQIGALVQESIALRPPRKDSRRHFHSRADQEAIDYLDKAVRGTLPELTEPDGPDSTREDFFGQHAYWEAVTSENYKINANLAQDIASIQKENPPHEIDSHAPTQRPPKKKY